MSCSRFPTTTRSCSATAARRRSGMRRRAAWSASARCTSRTENSPQVCGVHARRPVPGRPDRGQGAGRGRARAGVRSGCGCDRLGAQRDLDRGDGAGHASGRLAGRGAGADRRDIGRGRPAGRSRSGGCVLLRAPEGIRVRRRVVVCAAEPSGAGADRGARCRPSGRPLDPGLPVAVDRRSRTRSRSRLTTRPRSRRSSC